MIDRVQGFRLRLAISLAGLLALAIPSAAAATTTIGQVAPGTSPGTTCQGDYFDLIGGPVSSGASYVVPPGAAKITSWSTNAADGAGQTLTMKVFRILSGTTSGTTYQVIGHDGPHTLTGGTVNTFPVDVPVQPGDVLGSNTGPAPSTCVFPSTPADTWFQRTSDLADGQSGAFSSTANFRVNVSAVVAFPAPSEFSFGKVTRNKHKGTATLAVEVPGSGTVSLRGDNVKTQRAGGGAVASKAVTAAGTLKLKVKAKGNAKYKLKHTGKAKVGAQVTFTPDGASTGEAPGPPRTLTKRVKLIKKLD